MSGQVRVEALEGVARALGDGQGVTITRAAVDLGFPRSRLPARVADVLAWFLDEDVFADDADKFRAEHEAELPDDHYPAFAMAALLALGQPVTMDTVTDLVRRARTGDAPYDPTRDLALLACGVSRMGGPFSPVVAVAMANLKSGGVFGTADEIEARIRALVERKS
jgi:hypothetical protein